MNIIFILDLSHIGSYPRMWLAENLQIIDLLGGSAGERRVLEFPRSDFEILTTKSRSPSQITR